MKKNKIVHVSIISIFVSLYLLVATISMINSVDFFNLSHSGILSWSLAVGFELGAAASLAAIIILDKTNKQMVWGLFILLTIFQMMANSYHAFAHLDNYQGWIELFGLEGEEPITQKRILAIVSGAVLPLVSLGFIKSLTDYIKPSHDLDDAPDDQILKTEEDAEIFFDKIENPEPPNAALQKAAERYKEEVSDVAESQDDKPEIIVEPEQAKPQEAPVNANPKVEESDNRPISEPSKPLEGSNRTGDYITKPRRGGTAKSLPWG